MTETQMDRRGTNEVVGFSLCASLRTLSSSFIWKRAVLVQPSFTSTLSISSRRSCTSCGR
ncbi:ent-kaurene oxidase [Colletotrichum asianum]